MRLPNASFLCQPSRYYCLLLGGLLLFSLCTVEWLVMSFWVKMCTLTMLAIYGLYLFYNAQQAIRLTRLNDSKWQLADDRSCWQGRLCGESIVTTWVLVLIFRLERRFFKKTVVIFRDALSFEEYRQLLVILRMG